MCPIKFQVWLPFLFFFLGWGEACGSSRARGRIASPRHSHARSKPHLQPTSQPQQCWIWAISATYAIAFSNARSLTHWVRPGIGPLSSWILCQVLKPLSQKGNPQAPFFTTAKALRHCWSSRGLGQVWRKRVHAAGKEEHLECLPEWTVLEAWAVIEAICNRCQCGN